MTGGGGQHHRNIQLHKIDAIKGQNLNFDQGLGVFVSIGKDLNKSIKFSDKKFLNYCSLITLRTYIYYSKQVLHDLIFKLGKRSVNDENINFTDYPDFNKIIIKLQKIYDDNKSYIDYHEETMKMLENYYVKK